MSLPSIHTAAPAGSLCTDTVAAKTASCTFITDLLPDPTFTVRVSVTKPGLLTVTEC